MFSASNINSRKVGSPWAFDSGGVSRDLKTACANSGSRCGCANGCGVGGRGLGWVTTEAMVETGGEFESRRGVFPTREGVGGGMSMGAGGLSLSCGRMGAGW